MSSLPPTKQNGSMNNDLTSSFGVVGPSFSTSMFRRGYSGILDEARIAEDGRQDPQVAAGASTTTIGAAALARAASSAALLGEDDAVAQQKRNIQRVTFPTIPYYGVLKGFALEVQHHVPSMSSATRTQSIFPLLEAWARQGGGQSWRFGVAWSERQLAPVTQLRLLTEAKDAASNAPPPPVSAPAPPPLRRGSNVLGGHPQHRVWYGEYIEALSDASHQFFQLCCDLSRTTTTANAHRLPPPTLYVELSRHSRWKDLTAMLFYESGVPNLFMATSHRPTQRYVTQRAEEVDVVVEWVNGATLVSSSTPTQACGGAGEGHGRRRARVVDPCRVLAEIILNLDLLTTLTSGPSAGILPLPPSGVVQPGVVPPPQMPASAEVSVTTTYPFLHGTLQCHRVRPQGTHATKDGSKSFFVSASCTDGAVEIPRAANSSHLAADADEDQEHVVVSARCVSCFVRGPPLLGTAIASLLSVLIDVARLDTFTLRFQPYQTFRASAATNSSAGQQRTGGATGVGLSAVGRDATSGGTTAVALAAARRSSVVVVVQQGPGSGASSSGLCYSRLSTPGWLQPLERAVVAANARAVEGNDSDDDYDEEDGDDAEAEFYPLLIDYRRECLTTTHTKGNSSAATDAASGLVWGQSFLIENAITSMFGFDG